MYAKRDAAHAERLTRERDTNAGRLTKLTTERDRLVQELERERKAAEGSRARLAERGLAGSMRCPACARPTSRRRARKLAPVKSPGRLS